MFKLILFILIVSGMISMIYTFIADKLGIETGEAKDEPLRLLIRKKFNESYKGSVSSRHIMMQAFMIRQVESVCLYEDIFIQVLFVKTKGFNPPSAGYIQSTLLSFYE